MNREIVTILMYCVALVAMWLYWRARFRSDAAKFERRAAAIGREELEKAREELEHEFATAIDLAYEAQRKFTNDVALVIRAPDGFRDHGTVAVVELHGWQSLSVVSSFTAPTLTSALKAVRAEIAGDE